MASFDLKGYLSLHKKVVEEYISEKICRGPLPAPRLCEAMRYSLEAGGKRLRPILVLSSWGACRGLVYSTDADAPYYPPELLATAAALEMIHTYSLIHDDLPAMDNDDLRRGRPTSHRVFGEAMAILAGDALLSEAFALMAGAPTDRPKVLLKVLSEIAEASGIHGMAGGQVLDLHAEGKKITPAELEVLHRHKTGRLIEVSCLAGGMLAEADESRLSALRSYGERIGLAFQITDDILDVEGGTEELGKIAGADAVHNKQTYVSVLGLSSSKKKASELVCEATDFLSPFGESAMPLREIAHYIVKRSA